MRRTEIRVLHGGWAVVVMAVWAMGCAPEVAELAVTAPDGRSVARLRPQGFDGGGGGRDFAD